MNVATGGDATLPPPPSRLHFFVIVATSLVGQQSICTYRVVRNLCSRSDVHDVFRLRRPTSSPTQHVRKGTHLRWAYMLHNLRRRLTVFGAASRPRTHPDRRTPP